VDDDAPAAARPLGSLRGQLMRWLLLPLAGLIVVNTIVTYGNALTAVDFAYDRTLLATARAISERIQTRDGRIIVDVPYVALDIFESDSPGRLYYKVTGIGGEVVSGYSDFPSMPADTPRSEAYPALVHFYDAVYDGNRLRAAALHQPVYDGDIRGIALIQVGETMDARHMLTRQIMLDSFWSQAFLVAMQAVLALFALRLALGPLIRLRREVESRVPADLSRIDPTIVHREVRPLIGAINHYMAMSRSLIDRQRRFIADASHQLRTPLTLLKTHSELAARATDRPALDEVLASLKATTDQAVHLSNQLLSLARAEQAGSASEFVAVELDALARQVCLDLAPKAVAKDIALTLDVPPGPSARVRGDRILLREAMVNLVENAIRYAPLGGQIVVRTRRDPAPAFEVEDNGPGIAPEERARVIEPFYRVPRKDEVGPPGTGLGLAIVTDICRSHGASLELDAGELGRGLKATIEFPVGIDPNHHR